MPLCIADFPNQQYYHGKLVTPSRAPCPPPKGFRWPSNDAICFIDAFGSGEERDKTSLYNAHEAHAIAECIYWLHHAGDVVSSDVVVLSFYQRQVKQIRCALQQQGLRIQEVTTVDGFQGSEAPVVIVSTVRCNAFGHIGFAGDARRLNVAMTRACKALLIFGSRWTLTAQDGLGTWTPFFAFFEQQSWIQKTSRIAPDESKHKVLPRAGSEHTASKSTSVSPATTCQDAVQPSETSRLHRFSTCMIRGDDVKELLRGVETTALALSGHGDYKLLLAHVLAISAREHKWGETVDDVMKMDRKQLSHLNALYRYSIPIDATNYIYFFCLCLLVKTSPEQHSPLASWTAKLARTSSNCDLEASMSQTAYNKLMNDSGDIVEAIGGICQPDFPDSVKLREKLGIQGHEFVLASINALAESLYLVLKASDASEWTVARELGLVEVPQIASAQPLSQEDVAGCGSSKTPGKACNESPQHGTGCCGRTTEVLLPHSSVILSSSTLLLIDVCPSSRLGRNFTRTR